MSWLQNTFRGLLFKNVAFNLTIQVAKKVPVKKNKTAKKMKNFAVNLVCLKFICLKNILYQNSSVLNKKSTKKRPC